MEGLRRFSSNPSSAAGRGEWLISQRQFQVAGLAPCGGPKVLKDNDGQISSSPLERGKSLSCDGVPIEVESGEVFAQAIGVIGGFALSARGGEQGAAGFGQAG